MTDAQQVPITVVIGHRVVHVRVDRTGAPRSMIVKVEVDYEQSWSFEEPGWQDIAFGAADDLFYWWSARHLVCMSVHDEKSEPVGVVTDEDIRVVFAVPQGWLLVCETSVRLVVGDDELSRLEFGEALLAARWEASRLVVRDANGHDAKVVISDGSLTT